MTWNVHGSAKPEVARLAEVLAEVGADAVALQEIRRGQARRLARLLGWEHEWVFKHNGYWPLWWRAEGLAIVAPSALEDVWRVCLSVGVGRRSHRRRVAIGAVVRRGAGGVLHLVDTHLATGSPAERAAQVDRLLAAIPATPRPLVVAGDLNARDEIEVLRAFGPAGLVDAGGADTSPAVAPVQRIDYVLVPASAEVLDRYTPSGGVQWAALSDHLPTLVEFTS